MWEQAFDPQQRVSSRATATGHLIVWIMVCDRVGPDLCAGANSNFLKGDGQASYLQWAGLSRGYSANSCLTEKINSQTDRSLRVKQIHTRARPEQISIVFPNTRGGPPCVYIRR